MKKYISSSIISIILLLLFSCGQKAELGLEEDPFTKLLKGNNRFVNNKPLHPDESSERKKEIAEHQKPFAAIISCSDSRVPPEIIFDQGLGDLFVIRTAGNLIGDIELGSLEYALEHLEVKLVVVLGHQNCGVIKAFLSEEKETGYIANLVSLVENKEEEKKALLAEGDKMNNCVSANIENSVRQIKEACPVLLNHKENPEIKIIGAKYNLVTGQVEVLFNERYSKILAKK